MGAVIDESMQQRVEICVLGTTDVVGRGVMPRRPQQAARARSHPTPQTPQPQGAASAASSSPSVPPAETVPANRGVVNSSGERKTTASASAELTLVHGATKPVAQPEFTFGEIESRGFFDKTDRNLFEGQDLDVPTYLRKGIKISL